MHIDVSGVLPFLDPDKLARLRPGAEAAHATLLRGEGAGADFLGWRDILDPPDAELLERIASDAREIRERADVLVCVGIGGSYLGSKAVIDALEPYFGPKGGPEILFAGHHMSGSYIADLLAHLEGKSVYVNVISKSGTTLEPALAFRFLRKWMEDRFDDASRRIIVTTDPDRGALTTLSKSLGYRKYVIPPSVGGRFSVLTPVGLLPIAVSGVDIRTLVGAAAAERQRLDSVDGNPAIQYASVRYLLHEAGYAVDLLAVFEPRLSAMGGWWQQLFGESEGKRHRGLFPATVQYSTDLHSLGQWVQDGPRNVLETFLVVEDDGGGLSVPAWVGNEDGLNYVAGRTVSSVNRTALEGTALAHAKGGVPTIRIGLDDISPASIGRLIYFFEHAVAVSGYLLGINPFDQPGVEDYKREMFRLLGKS